MRFTGDPQMELQHTELAQYFDENDELQTKETQVLFLYFLQTG